MNPNDPAADTPGIDPQAAFAQWRPRTRSPARTKEAARTHSHPLDQLPTGGGRAPGTDAGESAPAPEAALLRLAVDDAAHRAQAALGGDPAGMLGSDDPFLDTVRILQHNDDTGLLEHAAAHLNLTVWQLRTLTHAYSLGGEGNVLAAHQPLPAHPDFLAQAEQAIQPHRPAPLAPIVRNDNQLTDDAAHVQLRLVDQTWYPFVDRHGTWRPVPGHSTDPATAYRAARRAR